MESFENLPVNPLWYFAPHIVYVFEHYISYRTERKTKAFFDKELVEETKVVWL